MRLRIELDVPIDTHSIITTAFCQASSRRRVVAEILQQAGEAVSQAIGAVDCLEPVAPRLKLFSDDGVSMTLAEVPDDDGSNDDVRSVSVERG